MKVLLTGSAGFIGSFVALRLLERGDEVVGLDNLNDYYDPALKYGRLREAGVWEEEVDWYKLTRSHRCEGYRFIRMNLEDRQAMRMLFANEGFDAVIHLAAQAGVRYSIANPYAYVESNLDGFINVLEGCRHHKVAECRGEIPGHGSVMASVDIGYCIVDIVGYDHLRIVRCKLRYHLLHYRTILAVGPGYLLQKGSR